MLQENSLLLNVIFQSIKKFFHFTASLGFWDGILVVIIVAAVLVIVLVNRNRFKVSSATINLPFSLGNITYELAEKDRSIAWQLYVQLITRKAALIFDEENDVIVEIYDSLYELFGINRELLMKLSLKEVEREPGLADLILRVQNDGLRPHLTQWQANFRKWWESAIKRYKTMPLQKIQKRYPRYKDLVNGTNGIKIMNTELNKYAMQLLHIAKAKKKKKKKVDMKITPEAPSVEMPSTQST